MFTDEPPFATSKENDFKKRESKQELQVQVGGLALEVIDNLALLPHDCFVAALV
jgi:hypothetical protein